MTSWGAIVRDAVTHHLSMFALLSDSQHGLRRADHVSPSYSHFTEFSEVVSDNTDGIAKASTGFRHITLTI